MPQNEVTQDPQRSTSGLSSGSQLVGGTITINAIYYGTSFESLAVGSLRKPPRAKELAILEERTTRMSFSEALRDSMRRDKAILKALAKY